MAFLKTKRMIFYTSIPLIVIIGTLAWLKESSKPLVAKTETNKEPIVAVSTTPEPKKETFINPYSSIDLTQAEKNEKDSLKEIKHHPEIEAVRVQQDIDALKTLASITPKNKEEQKLLEKVFTDKGNQFYQALAAYDSAMGIPVPEDKYKKATDDFIASMKTNSSSQPDNTSNNNTNEPMSFGALQIGIRMDKQNILKKFPDIVDIGTTSDTIVVLKGVSAKQNFSSGIELLSYTASIEFDSKNSIKPFDENAFLLKSSTQKGGRFEYYPYDTIHESFVTPMTIQDQGVHSRVFVVTFHTLFPGDMPRMLVVSLGKESVYLNF